VEVAMHRNEGQIAAAGRAQAGLWAVLTVDPVASNPIAPESSSVNVDRCMKPTPSCPPGITVDTSRLDGSAASVTAKSLPGPPLLIHFCYSLSAGQPSNHAKSLQFRPQNSRKFRRSCENGEVSIQFRACRAGPLPAGTDFAQVILVI